MRPTRLVSVHSGGGNRLLNDHDLEGIGFVIVDSEFEVRNMYTFTREVLLRDVGWGSCLARTLVNTISQRHTLANMTIAGSS